jgi:hypothetical protein
MFIKRSTGALTIVFGCQFVTLDRTYPATMLVDLFDANGLHLTKFTTRERFGPAGLSIQTGPIAGEETAVTKLAEQFNSFQYTVCSGTTADVSVSGLPQSVVRVAGERLADRRPSYGPLPHLPQSQYQSHRDFACHASGREYGPNTPAELIDSHDLDFNSFSGAKTAGPCASTEASRKRFNA